jgi:MFS transporter, NNP family, nitrate/nitrite transporter
MALTVDGLTAEKLAGHRPRVRDRKASRAHWIDDWNPEDVAAWQSGGQQIARRNLIFSIVSEHIGFCVWSLWSVFVLFLGKPYGLTPADKFLLTSVPTAVGAGLRLPYTLAVAKFGGRNWTVISALLLLIPTTYIAIILKPGVSLNALLVGAALAGVGGGNFSSSMANIDSFYPQRLKGWALGLNAGGGNIGVAATQLVGLAVLTFAGRNHPRVMLGVYMPLIVLSALCASRYMDNLSSACNDKGALRDVATLRHTWTIAVLYIGTFGSFVGFSFAFGQVLQVQFADIFNTPVKAAYITFLGPLLGSIMRPLGGKLADRHGGALITSITFASMIVGGGLIVAASVTSTLWLFIAAFVALFVLTGIGNGSIYKMIPTIFRSQAQAAVSYGADADEMDRITKRRSRALIGMTGAVGSFGGVLVNLTLRQSFLSSGSGTGAYIGFIAFYAICLAVTVRVYLRPKTADLAGV